jgi:hypothetical protein
VEYRGIDLLRFGLPANVDNNAAQTPSNARYYQNGTSGMDMHMITIPLLACGTMMLMPLIV